MATGSFVSIEAMLNGFRNLPAYNKKEKSKYQIQKVTSQTFFCLSVFGIQTMNTYAKV